MTRLYRPPALPIAFVALYAFAGCVAAGASLRPPLAAGAESPVVPRTYGAGGITLGLPSSNAPGVDVASAYRTCISGEADCPAGAPRLAELASTTDDQYGDLDTNGTATHTIQGRLSWVFTWQGVACPPSLGPKPPGSLAAAAPVCDWLVIVDAQSGKYLISYAGPPSK